MRKTKMPQYSSGTPRAYAANPFAGSSVSGTVGPINPGKQTMPAYMQLQQPITDPRSALNAYAAGQIAAAQGRIGAATGNPDLFGINKYNVEQGRYNDFLDQVRARQQMAQANALRRYTPNPFAGG